MPRKNEISFETKKFIWDMAVKGYRDKYSAIQRHLDKVLAEQGLDEDTPGIKLIKRIINEDINALSAEVVVSELPQHMWELRDDYESIKQLAKRGGQTSAQSELDKGEFEQPNDDTVKSGYSGNKPFDEEKVPPAMPGQKLHHERDVFIEAAWQHDVTIFKKSDTIMDEEDIQLGLGVNLECSGFIEHTFRSQLSDFVNFFDTWEVNKYVSSTLSGLCESMCNKIKKLEPLLYELSVQGSTHDGDGNKILGLILKDTIPPEQIEALKKLSASCRIEHQKYRIAVRELLFL